MRWLKNSGRVSSDFYILGSSDNPVYLLQFGDYWTLIEGGMSKHRQVVLAQLKHVVGDLSKVRHWILTHAHYDHCGLPEFLIPHLPSVTVYASPNAIGHFAKEKYRKTIYRFNDVEEIAAANSSSSKDRISLHHIPMVKISEGDTIKVGKGQELSVISTPGHSDCSVSIYDAANERLFVSDALGEITADKSWFPLAFQSMNEYIQSLIKISKLPVNQIALGHYGIVNGSTAKSAALHSLTSTYKIIEQVEGYLKKHAEVSTVAGLLSKAYSTPSQSFVPENVHVASMNQLVSILKQESFIL